MAQAGFTHVNFGETFGCTPPFWPGLPCSHWFNFRPETLMEAFLISTGIVALAEMGDKTQLLALILAARFRKPWPIVWGIFVATLANHAMAGAVGAWVNTMLGPDVLRWVLGVSFIAMAVWMLIPDKMDDDGEAAAPRFGIFGTTVVAFFLAEMGDKTQIATVNPPCRDPKDNQFLALCQACAATVLVSSDADLLVLHPWHGIPILTPATFLQANTP